MAVDAFFSVNLQTFGCPPTGLEGGVDVSVIPFNILDLNKKTILPNVIWSESENNIISPHLDMYFTTKIKHCDTLVGFQGASLYLVSGGRYHTRSSDGRYHTRSGSRVSTMMPRAHICMDRWRTTIFSYGFTIRLCITQPRILTLVMQSCAPSSGGPKGNATPNITS
eukprot:GHVH01007971.1.p1 GENE.GHVH01007971.1~~GHVH01007971.1.p1  ORF type:complete len:167 (+),score=10.88 GHVH01007971.1:816-1316(+)